ncbi:MAG: hypothetical protein P8M12_08175 [Flavobacteriales bacterium]|nr:hypothetical protein [Flavobacteriales bacterium]
MDVEKLNNYLKLHTTKIVETKLGEVIFLRGDIIYVAIKNGIDLNLEEGIFFRNTILSEYESNNFSLICDTSNFNVQVSIEIIKHFMNDCEYNSKCSFQAIIMNNMAYELMGNFYLKFLQKSVAARLFKKEDDALKWVLDNFKTSLSNQNMELV